MATAWQLRSNTQGGPNTAQAIVSLGQAVAASVARSMEIETRAADTQVASAADRVRHARTGLADTFETRGEMVQSIASDGGCQSQIQDSIDQSIQGLASAARGSGAKKCKPGGS